MNITFTEAKVILNWYEHATKETYHRGGETIITSAENRLVSKLKQDSSTIELTDEEVLLAGDWMLKTTRAKQGSITSLLPEEKTLYEKITENLHISQGIDIAKGMVDIRQKYKQVAEQRVAAEKKKSTFTLITFFVAIIVILFLFWQFGFQRYQKSTQTEEKTSHLCTTSPVRMDMTCRGTRLIDRDSIALWFTIHSDSVSASKDDWVQIEFLNRDNEYAGLEYQVSLTRFRPEYKLLIPELAENPLGAFTYTLINNAKKVIARGRATIEFEEEK